MSKKYVPNDVFRFRLTLKRGLDKLEFPVYTTPFPDEGVYIDGIESEMRRQEKLVESKYFTKERINELKTQFIKRIQECDNPFEIFCCDRDGGYNVTKEQLFNL
jgi:hypothetical protein